MSFFSRIPLKVRRNLLWIAAIAAYFVSTTILSVDPFDLKRILCIIAISMINQSLGAHIVLTQLFSATSKDNK